MSSAKRHKNMADAVRGVWNALGTKPKTEWVDVTEKTDRKAKIVYPPDPIILDPENSVIAKRRGRPPGSKNKPKAVTND